MNFEKTKSTDIGQIIRYYKAKPFEVLKQIKPLWAHGQFSVFILDQSIHPSKEEYIICYAKPSQAVSRAEFFEVNLNILFTGELVNDTRIARILYRWDNQFVLEPTIVAN